MCQYEETVIYGPVEQGTFLKGIGIGYRAQSLLSHASAKQAQDIQMALHRLCGPDEMGHLFKVMGCLHGYDFTPAGFTV